MRCRFMLLIRGEGEILSDGICRVGEGSDVGMLGKRTFRKIRKESGTAVAIDNSKPVAHAHAHAVVPLHVVEAAGCRAD